MSVCEYICVYINLCIYIYIYIYMYISWGSTDQDPLRICIF